MAMELSIWSYYYFDLSPEDALTRFKANGINAVELADEHGLELLSRGGDVIETGRKFGEYARKIGMHVPQGHLWLACKLVSNPDAIEILKNWIDLYHAIGIKNMVLHMEGGISGLSRDEVIEKNVEKLREIVPYIAGRGIRICLENLCSTGTDHIDDLLTVIEKLNSPDFGVTLDTGHLNIVKTTSQRDFILTAGDKLQAIHIADNEGATDQHMMPFGRGSVDFEEVVKTLKETGYPGILNYEIPGESRVPMPVRDAKLRYIREAYNYLMSL